MNLASAVVSLWCAVVSLVSPRTVSYVSSRRLHVYGPAYPAYSTGRLKRCWRSRISGSICTEPTVGCIMLHWITHITSGDRPVGRAGGRETALDSVGSSSPPPFIIFFVSRLCAGLYGDCPTCTHGLLYRPTSI